jgi:PhoPQ-activated pathogenicity-related protein
MTNLKIRPIVAEHQNPNPLRKPRVKMLSQGCRARPFLALISPALALLAASSVVGAEAGPLADYVAKPDASYGWKLRREGKFESGEFVELTLTSQTWHGIDWKHQLFIIKPNTIRNSSRALLLITGGKWSDELAAPVKDPLDGIPKQARMIVDLAVQLGTPIAVVLQVPFQPLFNGLSEDSLISYTFGQYLVTKDPTWPLLLPMAKSAVRAMDAVQAVSKERWQLDVKNFTVTGASKRGWTTWLTAAVDPRVDAFAPMVIDTLNMSEQMQHQVASWGHYSEQIHDYTDRGLQRLLDTDRGRALQKIIDPYQYRAALKQPKLILLGTNDRYWTLDALNLYWSGLTGDKYILYVPNVGHSLNDLGRVTGSLCAFHRAASGELKLPKLDWKASESPEGLKLTVSSDQQPGRVSAWVARSKTRDFRDATWLSSTIDASSDGQYAYTLPRPQSGFAAVFGETMFSTETMPYYLSTNVTIIGVEPAAIPATPSAGQ